MQLNFNCPQLLACIDNMGAALTNKRELSAEKVKEAKAPLEQERWREKRTVSVKNQDL
jgi:tRNA-dihydrouridine synthase